MKVMLENILFIEKRGNEKKSDSITIKKNDKGNESNNGEKKKKCC